MRMRTVGFLLLLCLVALVSSQLAYAASSKWVLYDNFDSGVIDPAAIPGGHGTDVNSGRFHSKRMAVGGVSGQEGTL